MPAAERAAALRHRLADVRWGWWLALIAMLWVARYAASFGLHLASPPRWDGWFDQDRYVRSAVAFAHGDLSAASHWYSLGYPILAAPFVGITRGDPFFLPDLGLFLLAYGGFVRAMAIIGITRGPGAGIFVLTALVGDSTVRLWMIPWNTTLGAALTWWLIAIAARIVRDAMADETPALSSIAWLGLLAGALPTVRPTEMLTSALAIAAVVALLAWRRRLEAKALATLFIAGAVVVAPFLLLHLAIYGPAPSTYMTEAAKQGFALADLPWKSYVLIVTAAPWYEEADSLIERLPWLLPGAAGLVVGLATLRGAARLALAMMVVVAIPYALLFIAYTDLQPSGLWEFGNAHYFTWLFPLFGTGAWLWLRAMLTARHRPAAIVALLAVMAPACIRVLPVAVDDGVPARMLRFRGSTLRDWNEAYFAPVRIHDDAGTMDNVGRFHQLPDAGGERAVAITRLFAGHPRRDDPGEAVAFAAGEPPYARYAVRLSPGVPCWFDRAACALPR